ncbi:hypothetical protein [Denitromonas sp.]|uniref:COG4648 family protein n=1 Tax=Denitromonas sp. TaxID=2734609 RepID=UPI002AFF26A0|nr:hypothetical protein [Denitromonas sp.]
MLPVVRTLLFAATPVAIYLALAHFEPRQVIPLLLVLVGLRLLSGGQRAARGSQRWLLAGALLTLAALVAISNSEAVLRLYPVLVNLAMLALFAHSLVQPPTVIERIARLHQPDLPPAGVAYTRKVTQLWCGFFIVNGAIAAYTAVLASRETWVWYNGGIAYALMGLLFAGEWLYRRQHFGASR